MGNRTSASALAIVVLLCLPAAAVAAAPACRVAVLEGEVQAGSPYEHPLGNGLRFLLEPIASGWILRVIPTEGPRGEHDFAELANPPYRSVSPLLIGTDFSFRAQDALAWNPRHFRFAPDAASFAALTAAYEDIERLSKPAPPPVVSSRRQALSLAEARLATLVSHSPEAELILLDARLIPGSADQARTAAMVASHPNLSARRIDQPSDGKTTLLGRITWLRFRLQLDLPKDFRPDPALAVQRSPCL